MATKRNQVTVDLRIAAEATLKDAGVFQKQLGTIINKFDFGDKVNNQLKSALEKSKELSKVLEKSKDKKLLTESELKDLTKAGKEMANLVAKTEKVYTGKNSAELAKFSRERIAQEKATQEAIAKIKTDYEKRTGRNYDKDMAGYDKLKAKVVELGKEKEKWSKSGAAEDLANQRIDEMNRRLDIQKQKLEAINELKLKANTVYNESLNQSARAQGFEDFSQLKAKGTKTEDQMSTRMNNQIYTQQKQQLDIIEKETKDISKAKMEIIAKDQQAIALANQYRIANVSSLASLKEQVKLQKEALNTSRTNRTLVDAQEVTAEFTRWRDVIQNAVNEADKLRNITIQTGIELNGNILSYANQRSLSTAGSVAQREVNTLTAQVSDEGTDSVVITAMNEVKNLLTSIDNKLTTANNDLSGIDETNKKLATQSERAADENDIKEVLNATDGIDENVNNYTTKDNDRIASDIIRLGITGQIPYGKELETLSQKNVAPEDAEFDTLQNHLDVYKSLSSKIENVINGLRVGIGEPEDLQQLIDDIDVQFDNIDKIAAQAFSKRIEEVQQAAHEELISAAEANEQIEAINKDEDTWRKIKGTVYSTLENYEAVIQPSQEGSKAIRSMGDSLQYSTDRMEKAAVQSQFLGSTFDDLKNKVGYLLSMNYIFDQVTRKIKEAVELTKQMDKDMTQIGLVLNKTSSQIWKNFETYSGFATRLNTTTSDVVNSMKLFYQQGLNTYEVNKMVEASAIAAALGESTMAEASETLTSIMNSYNLSANQALAVTDKISQVAIISAADFGELSVAIEKVASQAASVGLDLDHMMGYLGKMIETTREAPTNLGTALKTILANLSQFKENPDAVLDDGANINKAATALDDIGIKLLDANGEMRDLGSVLDELGGKWESLTRNQKAYLATQIAGNRQQSRFYALMNDYDRTLELVTEASDSAGKSQEQFALYGESLEAATKRLNNQWEIFFKNITNGNGTIKTLTKGLTGLMSIVNAIGPVGTILGLVSFIAQIRKSINGVNNFNKAITDLQKQPELFNKVKEIPNIKGLSKTEKRDVIQMRMGEKASDINIKDLDKLVKIANYKEQIKNLNIDLNKTGVTLTEKVMKTGNKAWLNVKSGVLQARVAVKAFGTALKAVAIQMIALWAVQKVIEAIQSAWKAAHKSAEDYYNTAEEARENASTVKALRDEYETLAKTINRTADEEKRMKEITKELSNINQDLGNSLRDNIDAFRDNISVMDDYIERQNKIEGQNQKDAAKAAMEENNTWGKKIGRAWNEAWGGDADEQAVRKSQGLYREYYQGAGKAGNLDSTQTQILNSFAEKLIDNNEFLNPDEWNENMSKFEDSVDRLIIQLNNMDKGDLKNYTELFEKSKDNSLSYSELKQEVENSNLSDEITQTFKDEIGRGIGNAEQFIKDNTGIENYSTLARELPREVLTTIFNPKNFESLAEEEQQKYWHSITKIFNDKKLRKQLLGAVEEDGLEGLNKFIRDLSDQDGIYLDIVKETVKGLTTLEESVTNAKKAFDELEALMNSGIQKGDFSQMDIIKGLLDDTFNINDINTIGDSSLLSVNFDGLLNQYYAKFNELKEPMQAQIDAIDQQVDYYTNYSDNLVKSIEDKITLAQDRIDSAQVSQQKKLEAKQRAMEKWQSEEDELNRIKSAGRSLPALMSYAVPLVGQGTAAATMTTHNQAEERYDTAGTNYQNADADWNRSYENLMQEYALMGQLNTELQEAKNLRDLMKMTDSEIVTLAKQQTDEFAKQNIEQKNLAQIIDNNGNVVGQMDSSRFNANQFTDSSKSQITEQNARDLQPIFNDYVHFYEDQENALKDARDEQNAYIDETVDGLQEAKGQWDKVTTAIEKIEQRTAGLIGDFKAVFESFSSAGVVDKELDAVADAWKLCGEGADGYFEVAQAIANDPSLIDALDMESQYLEFKEEGLKRVAESAIDAQIQELQGRLEGTNAIIGMIQAQMAANDAGVEAEFDNLDDKADIIGSAMAYNDNLTKNEQESTDTEGQNLQISVQNWQSWETAVIGAIQKAEDARAKFASNIASGETMAGSTGTTTFDKTLTGVSIQTGVSKDATELTNKEKYAGLKENLKQSNNTDLGSMLESYQKQRSILEKSINSLQKYRSNIGKNLDKRSGKSGGGGGGGSTKEFDKMIEQLYKFYNYLRKIEAVEAKITKIRSKRSAIDATKNYYIKDLVEENKLLKQQSKLYSNYAKDQEKYLATLRKQMTKKFGKWVGFTDEGVVQVKKTKWNLNSEKQKKEYEEFKEFLDLYESEYNSMLENQNKLLEIQAQIIENISTMYDKQLERINDVISRLEYMKTLTDHKITMEFSNIKKFDLFNDKIGDIVDVMLTSQEEINKLNNDAKDLKKTVDGLGFKELLTWDAETNTYQVNQDKLQDEAVKKKYEKKGYNWDKIVQDVNEIAIASQKGEEQLQELMATYMSSQEELLGMMEERISTIQDIFSTAGEELNKVFAIYERKVQQLQTANTLFGPQADNYEKQYQYLLTMAKSVRGTVAELEKHQSTALDALMKDYSGFVTMIDGTAKINLQAAMESSTLSDYQKSQIKELATLYESSTELINENTDRLYDYLQQVQDLERAKRDSIINLKNQLYAELMRIDQKEVDDLRKKYDKMNQLDKEYYAKLQQTINDARNDRQRNQEQQNIAQMQNRAAILQRDSSGQHNSELLSLNQQIRDALQTQSDNEVNREMERISREQAERERQRSLQIQSMENLITFKDENGVYWQESQALWEQGQATVTGFLMNAETVRKMSQEEQTATRESLDDLGAQSFAHFSTAEGIAGDIYQAMVDIMNEPLQIDDTGIAEIIGTATDKFIDSMNSLMAYLDQEKVDKDTKTNDNTDAYDNSGAGTNTKPDTPTNNSDKKTDTKTDTKKETSPTVGKSYKTKSGAKIYGGASGGTGYNPYYGTGPYTILSKSGSRVKVRYSKLSSGTTGWFNTKDIKGFSKGGMVDYTGIANVHGSKKDPEAFLNAGQTKLFAQLRDSLVKSNGVPAATTVEDNSQSIEIEKLEINVKEVADVASVDKIVRQVKKSVYEDATSGNKMQITRR